MTKEQALDIIKLLSAIESWSLCDRSVHMPDYLHEAVSDTISLLSVIVLSGETK